MTTDDDEIRVLIADDHPMYRGGLRVALTTTAGLDVVGEASDGEEAIERAGALQPDVVVMDVNMPGLNGIEATRRIVAESPHIGVLVLTMFDEDETVFRAMRAGARGYLLKGASQSDIVRAVRAVGTGNAIFGPGLARRLISYFGTPSAGAVPFGDLTDREREVLELLAAGHSNIEISRHLRISAKTVRNHVSNVFAKLQVADRAGAIVRAREAGLGRSEFLRGG
ncbi:MAG: response regulator transcription factor [Humibacillus sp.]|nr:response regulator transcription factor [Humibacillus sp.]MDN5777619.1 response regulator transcription factor [Humibacillus sp.]